MRLPNFLIKLWLFYIAVFAQNATTEWASLRFLDRASVVKTQARVEAKPSILRKQRRVSRVRQARFCLSRIVQPGVLAG